jgi:hypothetical protein
MLSKAGKLSDVHTGIETEMKGTSAVAGCFRQQVFFQHGSL